MLKLREMAVFAMLGGMMTASKIAMEALPNIHLLGMLTMTYTLVYRRRALIPIYIYVVLNGAFGGFNLWWVPYLYIWALLWGAAMLVPRWLSPRWYVGCLIALCAAHGYLFGVLYAPVQAVMFHLNGKMLLAWNLAGLPYDAIHGTSNLILGGVLIPPLYKVLRRLNSENRV